jgi:hypothetical protein
MDYLERLQKPRAVGLLALTALLVVFAACQLVAGVQSRTLDPIPAGCVLPSGSGPQVRFANVAPNPDALDVCIRATGTSWGEPLLLNGGTSCTNSFPSTGFTYGQITIPFAAPGGTVDVKTVMGGGTCNSAAVSELDGVKLLSAPACTAQSCVTTLIALGGASGQPKKLVALPEWDSQVSGNGGLFRVVNALPGVSALDVGSGDNTQLPATVTIAYNVGGPIPYGGTLTKGQKAAFGTVEDNGYMPIIQGSYNLAVAAHGQSDALLLFPSDEVGNQEVSLYAVGLAFNDSYPLEGLSCVESGQTSTSASNPLLMSCSPSQLPTLSFDVFNPALYGPNSPFFSQRDSQYSNSPATNPIATRTSDVMCLVEVDLAKDQQNIITVGKEGNFNYSYTIATNLSTPFSNGGAEQEGGTCPTTTQPACAAVPAATMSKAFACMEQYCSSTGDASGILNTTTDCLSSNCSNDLAPLLLEYTACFDCVVDNVASNATYSQGLTTCTTNPSPPLGYGGNNSSMILSKYPIVNQDSYVLPSTNYRRSVLYSQVQFPGNVTVDFYCGFLMTPLIASSVPYLGCFGNGNGSATDMQSEQSYLAENLFQAQKMAAWIAQKSKKSGNPAVIVGDWRVGLGQPAGTTSDGGYPPPTAIGEDTINWLTGPGGLQAVTGPNWPAAGQCNNCPGTVNLLNAPDTTSYFTMQPFLFSWPKSNGNPLVDEQLIFTDNVINLSDGGGAPNAPISPYYGVNFHILRPPPKTAQGDAGAPQ